MGRKQFASSEPEYASWGEAIKAYQTTHTTRAFPDDAYAKLQDDVAADMREGVSFSMK